MLGFIVRRILTALLVVFLTSVFVFVLLYKGVANPAGPVCDAQGRCTAERLAAIEKSMGLNDPILAQYGEFASGVVAGRTVTFGEAEYDCPAPCLGVSYGTRGLITDELVERLPATISLAVGGLDHLPRRRRHPRASWPRRSGARPPTGCWSAPASWSPRSRTTCSACWPTSSSP